LFRVAFRLELTPAPSIARPYQDNQVTMCSRLQAVIAMPPGLLKKSVPELIVTDFPKATVVLPVRLVVLKAAVAVMPPPTQRPHYRRGRAH